MSIKDWKKEPSVTPGGKMYFYTRQFESGRRYWVVWDRVEKSYVVQLEDSKPTYPILPSIFTRQFESDRRYWVVWDRVEQSYVVQLEDSKPMRTLFQVTSVKRGIAMAENYEEEYPKEDKPVSGELLGLRSITLKNRKAEHTHKNKFREIFGCPISDFMDPLLGFDIVKFDEYIKTPDGISTRDYLKKNNPEGCRIIEELIK